MKKIVTALLIAALICMTLVPIVSAAPKQQPSVKILSIGHSYSLDSATYLYEIASSQGVNMTIGVVYRGDCALSVHLDNFNNNRLYGEESGNPGCYLKYSKYYPDGKQFLDSHSIGKAVKEEDWDYIVFQECLRFSGDFKTINKSLPSLKTGIEKLTTNKNVKYMWHQLWAMEKTEAMPNPYDQFEVYNYDQNTMREAIKSATESVLEKGIGIDGVVPSGEAFYLARKSGKYDPTVAGGISLVLDNVSHGNVYGDYLAGLVWYMSFTGCGIDKQTVMIPQGITKDQAYELVDFATEAVVGTGKTLGTVEKVFSSGNDTQNGTSSEFIYTPGALEMGKTDSLDWRFLIPVGAAVAIAGCIVVITLKKKKKQ